MLQSTTTEEADCPSNDGKFVTTKQLQLPKSYWWTQQARQLKAAIFKSAANLMPPVTSQQQQSRPDAWRFTTQPTREKVFRQSILKLTVVQPSAQRLRERRPPATAHRQEEQWSCPWCKYNGNRHQWITTVKKKQFRLMNKMSIQRMLATFLTIIMLT